MFADIRFSIQCIVFGSIFIIIIATWGTWKPTAIIIHSCLSIALVLITAIKRRNTKKILLDGYVLAVLSVVNVLYLIVIITRFWYIS